MYRNDGHICEKIFKGIEGKNKSGREVAQNIYDEGIVTLKSENHYLCYNLLML